MTWTSPAGRVTHLDGHYRYDEAAIWVPPGALGLGMPDYDFYESPAPNFDGSAIRGHRATVREITLPVAMMAPSRSQLLALWRQLVVDLKPRRGQPGTLTLTGHDSEQRSIRAYYAGGLEGQDDDVAWGMRWLQAQVVLRCPSPYWLGEVTTETFQIGAGEDFYPHGFPMKVSDSQVLGNVVIDNTGDAVTYPKFTITGPVASIDLFNATTQELISVTGGLASGESMVIDTRESARSVSVTEVDGDVVNRYGSLTNDSVLWALAEGENEIDLEMPGSDENSSLAVEYQLRYLTAY